MPRSQSMPQVINLAPSAILMIARNLRWRQVRSPKPVRAAGGAAAIPLTTVVYAATSLTFQRAALPRRSWQPCATWPWACSPNRTGQCRRAPVPQPRPLTDPWRPSGSGSDQTDITQGRQSPDGGPDTSSMHDSGAHKLLPSTNSHGMTTRRPKHDPAGIQGRPHARTSRWTQCSHRIPYVPPMRTLGLLPGFTRTVA
jgi:hypothetical protein